MAKPPDSTPWPDDIYYVDDKRGGKATVKGPCCLLSRAGRSRLRLLEALTGKTVNPKEPTP